MNLRRVKAVGWFVLGCVMVCSAAWAQTSYPVGQPLIGAGLGVWRITSSNGAATQVDVAGLGFTRAWRIETKVDSSPAWAIELLKENWIFRGIGSGRGL